MCSACLRTSQPSPSLAVLLCSLWPQMKQWLCVWPVFENTALTLTIQRSLFFFFPLIILIVRMRDRGESKLLSSCCFRTRWRQQVYTGQKRICTVDGASYPHPKVRGSSRRKEQPRHPEPQCASSEGPRMRGISVCLRPRACERSGLNCRSPGAMCVPGLLPHGAKVKCWHLLTRIFDTAIVGITWGFYPFYLIKSGWRRRSWNTEVGHTLCGTKAVYRKELNSLVLETSVAFSGFGLIITSSLLLQAVWFCDHAPHIEFY